VKRWLVITPEVETVVPILDDGSGPTEIGADVIEVEAETRRDAIALGVRLMLRSGRKQYTYCRDQRSDRCSPFAGVRAVEYQP
jgi:hypothetical protein